MRAGPKSRSRRRPRAPPDLLPGAPARTVTRPSSKQDTRNEIAPLLDTGSGRGRSEARVLVAVAAAAAAVPAAAAAASITAAAAAASVAALAVAAAAAAPTTPITATSPIAAAAAAPTSVRTAAVPAPSVKIAALLLRLELGQDLTHFKGKLVEVLLLAEGEQSLRRRASHVEDRLRRFLADADRTNSIIVVRRRSISFRYSF